MEWTYKLLEELSERVRKSNYAQVAAQLSEQYDEFIHPERLRSALRRHYARNAAPAQADIEQSPRLVFPGVLHIDRDRAVNSGSRFPDPVSITEQPVLTLEDPNVLIIGDIHAPYHSPEMLERAVSITHKYFPHIRNCMVIGDLFDFAAISNHLNNQAVTSTETDLRAGGRIAKQLRAEFELWIGPGNHDERISKKLNSEFSMESLLCGAFGNTDEGLHITDLDYFYIGDEIIAGHPTMYSSKPTGVASKIALLQRKNTITGHSHKVGITVNDDGVHWSIDNGHCANSDLFYYVRRRMSTFGKMGAGFTIISNGKPFVFGDAITDWAFWN